MKKITTLLFAIILASCSHKYYTNSNFDDLTASHKNIAILPVELKYLGNKPNKLTLKDIEKIEMAESKTFQQSIFNKILAYGNDKKFQTTVNIVSLEKTNSLLQNKNINYTNISSHDDVELCKILNVDAIVRLSISKTRYMSDLAGFGSEILNDIIRDNIGIFIPGTTTATPNAPEKTGDVKTVCTVQANNTTLWNNNYDQPTDWQKPANQIIEEIAVHYAKTFPYRKAKK